MARDIYQIGIDAVKHLDNVQTSETLEEDEEMACYECHGCGNFFFFEDITQREYDSMTIEEIDSLYEVSYCGGNPWCLP